MSRGSILYIPGLGNERLVEKQRHYVNFLNRVGKPVYFFDADWQSEETAAQKHNRLMDDIESLGVTRLFAVSAGASLAIAATGESQQITRTYTVCGKVTGSERITYEHLKRGPALLQTVLASEEAIYDHPRLGDRVTTFRPLFNAEHDGVIGLPDMTVPSARNTYLPSRGHIPTIIMGMATVLPVI